MGIGSFLSCLDVGRSQVDRDGAHLQRLPQLLRDVVRALCVLHGQKELVAGQEVEQAGVLKRGRVLQRRLREATVLQAGAEGVDLE